MTSPVYLDYASTAPVRREVLETMFPFFQQVFGNPSSVHSAGLTAAVALEEARDGVADVLGCIPDEVVFTSGGTESDNLALTGVAEASGNRGHIILSSIEHDAVRRTAESLSRNGFRITILPVDRWGVISPVNLESAVEDDTILVSCMLANNEIGTTQDIRTLRQAVGRANPRTLFHTDAVQAAGWLKLDVGDLGVDLLSLSAHKIGGPRGVGALYVRRGVQIAPLIFGGGQERTLRSGTENVAGVVGFAKALTLADHERTHESRRLAELRDVLIQAVTEASHDASLTGHPEQRLAGHASFVLLNRTAESVLVDLDVLGIQCSSGSACHAGQTDPSHVLQALGYSDEQAKNGLRMTMGHGTTEADVTKAVDAIGKLFHSNSPALSLSPR